MIVIFYITLPFLLFLFSVMFVFFISAKDVFKICFKSIITLQCHFCQFGHRDFHKNILCILKL